MTIKVYPSTAPDAEVETHDVHGMTIGEWFDSHDLCCEKLNELPPHVEINGRMVGPDEWDSVYIDEDDTVEIWMQPAGGVFKALGSLIGGVLGFLLGWLMPSQRSRRSGSPEQGRKLEASSARANTARLGDVVPELAGRHIKYPDYLNQPRRYFRNRREQWLEFLCCIGPGRYQVDEETVRVGDTTFANLGDDGSYQIYEPNADLSDDPIHENWYAVDEVGGTSSGTAGLELMVEPDRKDHTDKPAEYIFSGNTITIPEGEGSFPPGWGPDTQISIELEITRTYEVTAAPFPTINPPNVFTGDFSHLMPISDDDEIHITDGVIVGTYLAQDVDLNPMGIGSLQLWTVPDEEQEVPSEPVTWIPEGDHDLATLAVYIKTLLGASEEFVTYGGDPIPAMTSPAEIDYHGGAIYGEFSSLFVACPAGELTTRFECDFFFPGGLGYIEDSGNIANRSVTVEIQYRDANIGGAFTSVVKTFTDSTQDQIGFTEAFDVPLMRPEVRIRRVGVNETSTQVLDTVQWYSLRSRLPTVTRYPNWTVMAVRMRSGGRMSAQSENQVNVIATRILPELIDGQWTAPAPTRDIAAFVKYIASTIGYTDDDLDMEALSRLNDLWRARGETVDYVFDETTVKKAIDVCFGAGMSELTVSDGKIKPVRDDVRTTFETEQGYSPQNMTRNLVRQFKTRSADDPDGVEVEFMDAATWEPDVVRCFLPGDQGFKIEKIKLDGVTDRTRAWRIGMRHRSMQRYNRWEYSFATELDAMNSEYLSYVPLLDDVPGYGQSSILEHIQDHTGGALMFVSEPMNWSEAGPHVVAYRRPDGTVAGPYPASRGADDYQIIADVPKPWPVVTLKHEPPHVYFGTTERWCFPALITSIKPSENGTTASVEARNYDVRVYAHDNEQPPAQD